MVVPQVGSTPKRVLDAQPFDALAVLQVFAEQPFESVSRQR
jgi:hypothetical protein